jgi:hypothetical protein
LLKIEYEDSKQRDIVRDIIGKSLSVFQNYRGVDFRSFGNWEPEMAGAQVGFALLWLMPFTYPLMAGRRDTDVDRWCPRWPYVVGFGVICVGLQVFLQYARYVAVLKC